MRVSGLFVCSILLERFSHVPTRCMYASVRATSTFSRRVYMIDVFCYIRCSTRIHTDMITNRLTYHHIMYASPLFQQQSHCLFQAISDSAKKRRVLLLHTVQICNNSEITGNINVSCRDVQPSRRYWHVRRCWIGIGYIRDYNHHSQSRPRRCLLPSPAEGKRPHYTPK
jgi:hypothetical protein